VIVADGAVEIRYVIPTGPNGEREPFCRLRTDYLHRPPRREALRQGTPGSAHPQVPRDRADHAGVARPLRGGSARPSHPAISSTAHLDTNSFKRGSCRARCASVHTCPSLLACLSEWLISSRVGQMGTARRTALKQVVSEIEASAASLPSSIDTFALHEDMRSSLPAGDSRPAQFDPDPDRQLV
jgi:hypothetical protein